MMSDRIVLDASVAAKWFLKDEQDDLADWLLLALLADTVQVHAPSVFAYEVCGVLDRAQKNARVSAQQVIECAEKFFRLPITLSEVSSEERAGALKLAAEHRKGFYDMCYLWLAGELECSFCTADEKLLRGNPSSPPFQRLIPLSALG